MDITVQESWPQKRYLFFGVFFFLLRADVKFSLPICTAQGIFFPILVRTKEESAKGTN